jgi:hypothetical protein
VGPAAAKPTNPAQAQQAKAVAAKAQVVKPAPAGQGGAKAGGGMSGSKAGGGMSGRLTPANASAAVNGGSVAPDYSAELERQLAPLRDQLASLSAASEGSGGGGGDDEMPSYEPPTAPEPVAAPAPVERQSSGPGYSYRGGDDSSDFARADGSNWYDNSGRRESYLSRFSRSRDRSRSA